MSNIRYILINIFETLFRLFPVPCKTGLMRIGSPDRNSPVLVTGNYHLTVARVKKSLRSINCYLLVANSRGINVWCGSAGGHFTTHDVISSIKTTGIEKLVDHRQLIMPQLAATGVEGRIIKEKTGWAALWGPVYAKDIPGYVSNNLTKTPLMHIVRFPLTQRLEMAAAWAFPVSLAGTLLMIIPWIDMVLPMIALVWAIALVMYLAFPIYENRLRGVSRHPGFVFFDFGRGGFQIILWFMFMAGLIIFSFFSGDLSAGFIGKWGLFSFIIILILCMDLTGSTPVIKSAIHDDITLRVFPDRQKCRGAAVCEQVCPRDCFAVDKLRRSVSMPRADRCVRCGACIVQCPYDALSFRNTKGEVIPPAEIRKFKLNLLGKRTRQTAS